MPHFPKPYYKAKRRAWYVEIDRAQHVLGKHPEHLPEPVKGRKGWSPPQDVWHAYHRVMAESDRSKSRPAAPPSGHPHVATVLDEFTGWLAKRVEEGTKAGRTLDWYRRYLSSFLGHLHSLEPSRPPVPTLTVDQLLPSHVIGWVDSQPGWKTGRRGAMIAVQRAFNWAAKVGLLKSVGGVSPVRNLEMPSQGRRELLVSDADYSDVLSLVKDRQFRDLLELAWETGCRPHELFTVEASYVDLTTGRWIFPIRLSKGKKVQRVVYLSDRALDLTRRLVLEHTDGPLLRTTTGSPWCASSVKCRFQKLCRRLGRKRLTEWGLMPLRVPRLAVSQRKLPGVQAEHEARVLERRRQVNKLAHAHGLRLNLYAFRHSRITESLVNGNDAVTTSVLAGHSDTTMISRHYAHLLQKHEHMRHAANRAMGA